MTTKAGYHHRVNGLLFVLFLLGEALFWTTRRHLGAYVEYLRATSCGLTEVRVVKHQFNDNSNSILPLQFLIEFLYFASRRCN